MSSTTHLQIKNEQTETGLKTLLIDLNKVSCPKNTAFERILLEALDTTFSKLSYSNKQAFYLHLKKDFGIQRATIPYKLEIFVNALEQTFEHGAVLVEAQVMAKLHSKVPAFKFSKKHGVLSFVNYLERLRSFLNND
jgi:hypothetical protein